MFNKPLVMSFLVLFEVRTIFSELLFGFRNASTFSSSTSVACFNTTEIWMQEDSKSKYDLLDIRR